MVNIGAFEDALFKLSLKGILRVNRQMNIKWDRLVKTADDDSLSALWVTGSNSSRTAEYDKYVKTPSSEIRGLLLPPPTLPPLHLLRLKSKSIHITQLTPRCPPHAQSGLISLLASRSLVYTETTQSTAGKKKCCPLCVCMDRLCGRMRKLGVGQAAWPGRDKTGGMGVKRRRPS